MEKYNEDLQIDEDIEFTKKDWKFERAGWVLLALFVLAATAGLFGRGGLIWDKTIAGSLQSGAEVEYSKFWRRQSPETLKITVSGSPTGITLQSEDLDKVRIEKVLPQPQQVDYGKDMVRLTYPVSPEPKIIKVFINPEESGQIKTQVITGNSAVTSFSVFVYP